MKKRLISLSQKQLLDNGYPDGFLMRDDWGEFVTKLAEEAKSFGIKFSQSHLMF